MFTPDSTLTAFCYILELLPVHFLAYYPFRKQLRFPSWVTLCLFGLISFAYFLFCCYLYGLGKDFRSWEFFMAFLYMIVYFFCVNADPYKLLFMYLFSIDYIMIVRGMAIFIDICFFREPGTVYVFLNTPKTCIIRMIPTLLTLPFMLAFLNTIHEKVFLSNAPQLWKVFWMPPSLTTFVVLLFTYNLDFSSLNGHTFLLARVCLLIMVIIVYYVMLSSLDALRLQGEAEERARNQENFLTLQRLQYKRLQKQIEETRQARHDLRQHLNLIQAYLDSGDNDALRDYIKKYGQRLPLNSWKFFCANYAVDTIIRYYAEQAEEAGIRFESQVNLPQTLAVEEPDICVLFGNLLENALEACSLMADESPFISIHAQTAGERAISITVDNSCRRAPLMEKGRFLSSKHSGQGTGTLSISNIAAQYRGIADFKYENGVFYASVFLDP